MVSIPGRVATEGHVTVKLKWAQESFCVFFKVNGREVYRFCRSLKGIKSDDNLESHPS